MNSLVLLTAMTATSGLFGGHHKQAKMGCKGGKCGRPVATAHVAPAPCATGGCAPAYAAPAYAAPTYAAPAPQAQAMSYTSHYYPAAAPSCATGACPKR